MATEKSETQRFVALILPLLDETFAAHRQIFTERGTSLLETLAGVTAEQASKPMFPGGATIAAHVAHVDFYIEVNERYIANHADSDTDWRAVWNTVGAVTPAEWDALQAKLRASYLRVRGLIETQARWDDDTFGCVMAIVAHTASHLGTIRQALRTMG